jgi:hypothetical protein
MKRLRCQISAPLYTGKWQARDTHAIKQRPTETYPAMKRLTSLFLGPTLPSKVSDARKMRTDSASLYFVLPQGLILAFVPEVGVKEYKISSSSWSK